MIEEEYCFLQSLPRSYGSFSARDRLLADSCQYQNWVDTYSAKTKDECRYTVSKGGISAILSFERDMQEQYKADQKERDAMKRDNINLGLTVFSIFISIASFVVAVVALIEH